MILRGFSGKSAAVACLLLIMLLAHQYVFAAAGPSAVMLPWSPESPVQVGKAVTFSASATDDSYVVGFEWDFDGDEEPDAYSAADEPGASAKGSVQHSFSEPASVYPAVRAIDDEDFVSPWAVLKEGGSPVTLVIGGTAAPEVTMGRWQPYSATGPDGAADTAFTFSASASSGAGLDRLEWDFDGDGMADATTKMSGASGSATTSHSYGTAGAWVPKVRAVDANDLPSVWKAYEQAGNPVTLDTFVPEIDAALTFERSGETTVDESGAVSTTFSFHVDTDAEIASFQWDFDGDAAVDLTTTSPSASHTYMRRGLFLPSVTVEDEFGTRTLVSPADAQGQPLYISVLAPGEDPALFDPVRTYCDNLTVEQLIATGRYNLMDFRSGSKVVIRGTAGDDLILGGGIQNLILAGAGDDCIIAGGGNDRVFGNAGNDILFGDSGDERLAGGPGNDTCSPGGGSDILVSCESKLES